MKAFIKNLPNEVWESIFSLLDGIDSLAALASTHKKFYKMLNRDFKTMCFCDGIYRFKGETWATAFSLAGNRAFDLSDFHVMSCPNSGMLAFYMDNSYLILTHIDFSQLRFELIYFSKYFDGYIYQFLLINRGKRIIINCLNTPEEEASLNQTAYLYDIESKQVLKKFKTTDFQIHWYTQLQNKTTVYDPFSNKQFDMPSGMEYFYTRYEDKFSEHRYVGLLARVEEQLYLKDMKTDELIKFCKLTASGFGHCIFEKAGLLFIRNKANEKYGYNNMEFYDLKTKTKLYELPLQNNEDAWDWNCVSNYSVQNYIIREFVIYNPRKVEFYTRFNNCLYPGAHQQKIKEEVCNYALKFKIDGSRRFDICKAHNTPVYFDYSTGKLVMMKLNGFNVLNDRLVPEHENQKPTQLFCNTKEYHDESYQSFLEDLNRRLKLEVDSKPR
ncbi:unnamed protein product [Bursaphelenchus okinawaensis]|uniref:F-box domain-containing protein n=1 Tax=Bursaphelenchus okinawaensis TaxID=465554 RepID=A0A811LAB7_9BILA|nr:unnamed protein product [Bursaphelenchus okinawaensis]CAG9120040.1 unnamed protein product [Bursaphelenchus okinawaensis]